MLRSGLRLPGQFGLALARNERLTFQSGKAASCVNGWSSASRWTCSRKSGSTSWVIPGSESDSGLDPPSADRDSGEDRGGAAGRRVVPESAVFEDLADEVRLMGLDEGDDLHGPAAFGAKQRIGLVDVPDEGGPTAAVEPGRFGNGRLGRYSAAGLSVRTGRAGGGVLGEEAASLVGVAAIVADEVLALVGDMLDEFGQGGTRDSHLLNSSRSWISDLHSEEEIPGKAQ